MNGTELERLRTNLIGRGYSQKYIRRLVDELMDHQACCRNDGRADIRHEDESSRLGAPDEILSAVERFPELRPFAHRNPALVFGALPFLLLGIGLTTVLLAIDFYANNVTAIPAGLSNVLAGLLEALPILLAGVVVFGITRLAIRSQMSLLLPVGSAGIMGLSGISVADVAFCETTHTVLWLHSWSFSGQHMASCFVVLAAAMMLAGWSTTHRNRNSGRVMV